MASRDPSPGARRPHPWRVVAAALVVLLVAVPLALGVLVGWYGINPPAGERLAPVGSEAHALLNSFPADSLIVEIDYVQGWAPPAGAVSLLLDRINETCDKSSVTVQSYAFGGGGTSFSDADLLALESSNRHTWPTWSTMSLDYLVLNGGYSAASSTIGLAYRGSSIAVFAGTIMADAPSQYAAVMATVMIHEFGHEIGLVGIDGAAPNEDPAHAYHSNDPNDVMYWQVDSTALFGLLGNPPSNQFDAADLQDLSTVRSTILVGEVLPWLVLGTLAGAGAGIAFYELRRQRSRSRSAPPS